MQINWMTNDPAVAARLKKADAHRERMRAAAADLPLADKVAAYRRADEIRDAAYKTIREG